MSDLDPRALICELCRQFYAQGWVSGTGGGISLRHGGRVFMAPSGVQKDRLAPGDLFVLDEEG
ncbi:MAG: class II aldolase/adducin family protein, partial [Sandaracinaceae bacterium]|nr:class II aldolase/adducin family protein [Sandaracinaceae bacterium]